MNPKQLPEDKNVITKVVNKKMIRHDSLAWDAPKAGPSHDDSVQLVDAPYNCCESCDFTDNQESRFGHSQSLPVPESEELDSSLKDLLFPIDSKEDLKPSSRKHGSIKRCIRAALTRKIETPSLPLPKDGSAHPSPTNHSKYYHTFTAASTSLRQGTVRVMDIFRPKQKVANETIQESSGKNAGLGVRTKIKRAADIFHPGRSIITNRNPVTKNEMVCSNTLFRKARGLSINDPFLKQIKLSTGKGSENSILIDFFKYHKCVEMMPTSAKVVIFDSKLLVRKALFALVSNGMHAAPIWDSSCQQYMGVLTVTDLIKVLQKHHVAQNILTDIEDHTLQNWKDLLEGSSMPLISIKPDMSLYDAIVTLTEKRIHRLPIIDPNTGELLYILTLKCILHFLFIYIGKLPQPSYMNKKLSELKIGTMGNIQMATEATSVIKALEMFITHRISAVPIVDSSDKLKGIYSKCDVINLAIDNTYDNLDAPLKEVIAHRDIWYEGIQRCTLDDTFYDLLEKIVLSQVHRLVIVDRQDKVIGMISLSDLMKHILQQPVKHMVH